jgi:hypothetical protein
MKMMLLVFLMKRPLKQQQILSGYGHLQNPQYLNIQLVYVQTLLDFTL